MKQKGEGRSTADTARESRQHEERAAGPAAQFTHHETASTQGRHTAPAATHHAGEDIHHHLHPAHLYSQREMAKTRGHHTTHMERAHTTPATTASGPSAISDAALKFPAIPPSMGCGAQLNAVTRGAPHPQERRLGLRTSSLLPSPHGHGRRQQPPHATASMHYKRSIQIHCNVNLVCACRNKKKYKKEKIKGSNKCKRTQKPKCTAEVHGGNNRKKTAQTHDCTAAQAAAIHTRFI
ncbi:hypothetical protein MOQ_000864 [Trypanosoma cruzi marinkellei]|uniref:Uncharacterized protein n=1 Tax=Trypanosoma cruzi marinkellei TaxID=85056 RepID=K2NHR1_TRYCR|nr:hypothetical protein MOQ_000864 [Trypanosoma cruzi marinkellei]